MTQLGSGGMPFDLRSCKRHEGHAVRIGNSRAGQVPLMDIDASGEFGNFLTGTFQAEIRNHFDIARGDIG